MNGTKYRNITYHIHRVHKQLRICLKSFNIFSPFSDYVKKHVGTFHVRLTLHCIYFIVILQNKLDSEPFTYHIHQVHYLKKIVSYFPKQYVAVLCHTVITLHNYSLLYIPSSLT